MFLSFEAARVAVQDFIRPHWERGRAAEAQRDGAQVTQLAVDSVIQRAMCLLSAKAFNLGFPGRERDEEAFLARPRGQGRKGTRLPWLLAHCVASDRQPGLSEPRAGNKAFRPRREHRGPLEQEGGLRVAPSSTLPAVEAPQGCRSPSSPIHTPPGFKHLSTLRFNLGELRSSAVQNSSAEEAAFGE